MTQLGGANMPPRAVSYLFEGVGAGFPFKFLFPSISHQNPFILIKFQKNSNQILFVPFNNPSKSFCSHQVPKQFPSNSFILIKFPKVPSKILLFPWLWRIVRVSTGENEVNGEN
jgi:hypothetical protein